MKIYKKNVRQLFILYCCALFFVVFLTPNRYQSYNRLYHLHLIPLQNTIRGLHRTPGEHFWPYWIGYFENLIGNILLFMPMGFLLKALNHKRSIGRIVLIGALVSICIELLQLTFKIGVCDIDDVILNTLGTACGVWVWRSLK